MHALSLRSAAHSLSSLLVGLAGLVVLGGVVWSARTRIPSVADLVPLLPDDVVALVVRRPAATDDRVARFLATRVPLSPPNDARTPPDAVLLVDTGGALHPVALFRTAAPPSSSSPGILWNHARLVGDASAVARIAASPRPVRRREDPALVRVLKENWPWTIIVRQTFLARQSPFLDGRSRDAWDVFAWSSTEERVTFHAVHHGVADAVRHGTLLLAGTTITPLALVDGFRAEVLVPRPLPPALDALRVASGVGEELENLHALLAGRPIAVAVVEREGSATPVLVASVAGIEEGALDALQALFVRRLSILHSTTDVVRRAGRGAFRHRRPGDGHVFLSREEGAGMVLLRAPCALRPVLREEDREACTGRAHAPQEKGGRAGSASPTDLVALVGRGIAVVGIDRAAVEDVSRAIRHAPARAWGTGNAMVLLDVDRLRRIPVITSVLDALPAAASIWVRPLVSLQVFLSAHDESTELRGSVELRGNDDLP